MLEHLQANISSNNDLDQWNCNWIWRATQCLIEAPDFNPSPKWIASRLNITIEKAVEAIEGLERLGIVRKDAGTYILTESLNGNIRPDDVGISNIYKSFCSLHSQLIPKLVPTDKYTCQYFLSSDEILKEYAPKFMQLYKELNEKGALLPNPSVYVSTVMFTNLTKSTSASEVQ